MERYCVRRGIIGWMVWDRERKGPAKVLDRKLIRLTEDQAQQVLRQLNDIHGHEVAGDSGDQP